MFGYVQVNQPELKIRDFKTYRAMYCGVCQGLRSYGLAAWASLNYDMTFLALVLTALYEDEAPEAPCHCVLHPLKKEYRISNQWTEYAADMTVLLTYYQAMDAWQDDHKHLSRTAAALLSRAKDKAAARWPRQGQAVADYVAALHQTEGRRDPDVERAAGLTGQMLAEIFAVKEDEWADTLRQLGFYLGKFIYLMDAFEDLERDRKHGAYNPLLLQDISPEADFQEYCELLLTSMIGEAARAFERLPLLMFRELLCNIVYSGVWSRWEQAKARREQQHSTASPAASPVPAAAEAASEEN